MGDPARGRGLPLKMHGLRPHGHGDETAGGEEHQGTSETGWDGSKVRENQIKKRVNTKASHRNPSDDVS